MKPHNAGFLPKNKCAIIAISITCLILCFFLFGLVFSKNFTRDEDNISTNVLQTLENKARYQLVCYYTFNTTHLVPEKIDYSMCSFIIMGFASIYTNNHSIFISDENIKLIEELAFRNNANAKLLVSIGGAGDETFGPMVSNHANRKQLIRSLMSLIKEYKLDGVDYDWEWPVLSGGQREKVTFIQLLHETRVEFERHRKKYYLSVAVAAVESIITAAYYVQHIAENVDFVNLMSYDYHFFTPFYPVTDYNAPLYKNIEDSDLLSSFNVNFSVNIWLSLGMPSNKIMLGLPAYGHTFRLRNNANHNRHAPAASFGFGTDGFAIYPQICSFLSSPFAVPIRDNVAKVPYAYDNHNWVSYDDVWSLSEKVLYIKDYNLGGAMVFSLNSDDYSGDCSEGGTFPLIRAVLSKLILND